jgi:hypothetical protein
MYPGTGLEPRFGNQSANNANERERDQRRMTDCLAAGCHLTGELPWPSDRLLLFAVLAFLAD